MARTARPAAGGRERQSGCGTDVPGRVQGGLPVGTGRGGHSYRAGGGPRRESGAAGMRHRAECARLGLASRTAALWYLSGAGEGRGVST